MSRYKSAIVVMAQNPYQYLSLFLCHHAKLVEKIVIIDHRSTLRLRDIKMANVEVVESNQEAQFQSEVTNAAIRDLKLYKLYDWIFVLDVDEFLPFTNKQSFNDFLSSNSNEFGVSFNWLNAVGIYPSKDKETNKPEALHELPSIFISKKNNPTIKVAINSAKTSYPFYFRTGAHAVVRLKLFSWLFPEKYKYKACS